MDETCIGATIDCKVYSGSTTVQVLASISCVVFARHLQLQVLILTIGHPEHCARIQILHVHVCAYLEVTRCLLEYEGVKHRSLDSLAVWLYYTCTSKCFRHTRLCVAYWYTIHRATSCGPHSFQKHKMSDFARDKNCRERKWDTSYQCELRWESEPVQDHASQIPSLQT